MPVPAEERSSHDPSETRPAVRPRPRVGHPLGGAGRLRTDAPELSLNGIWAFRLHPADPADHDEQGRPPFVDPGFDPAGVTGWTTIAVPAHSVLTAATAPYSRPIYPNIKYPFPLDPPHVPDVNPTGDHRRVFSVPAGFAGGGGRIRLRFDGVESRADVRLNGRAVGWFTGSRLPTEFDVTDLLVDGDNVLAVRVHGHRQRAAGPVDGGPHPFAHEAFDAQVDQVGTVVHVR